MAANGKDHDQLPEKSQRVLLRIIQQMREGSQAVIRLELGKGGGVRFYREERAFESADLPAGDDVELARLLSRA